MTAREMADVHFYRKLRLYRTAYSPVYRAYVGIKKVRVDSNGEYILDCHVDGYEGTHLFRVRELERYGL
jgi:hypothetical protein